MCVIVITTVFSYFSTPPLIYVCPISNYFVHHHEFSLYVARHSEPLHQFVFIL